MLICVQLDAIYGSYSLSDYRESTLDPDLMLSYP